MLRIFLGTKKRLGLRSLGLAEEWIDPSESAVIQEILRMNLKTMTVRDGIARRGQHAKHHGCVRAKFTVLTDIPESLRLGIFTTPRTYDARIRFSNGSSLDDRKPDAHGMAIKLFDVAGAKLLEGGGDAMTQDFVLTDHPVFFSRNLDEYLIFNKHFTRIVAFLGNRQQRDGSAPRFFGFIHASLALQIFHPDLMRRARAFASGAPVSPLATHYWSTTPYLLGPHEAVKYMARSEHPAVNSQRRGVAAADGLRDALRSELWNGPARFTFGVHRQKDPVRYPIEDPTVDWHTEPADFVPLAQIEIEQQEPDEAISADSLAEAIVYNPWHALPEHRPLGAINRTRRYVYVAMAKLRQEANRLPDTFSDLSG